MIGSQLGDWQIESELGRGQVGVVYLAVHMDDPKRRGAVKLLDDDRARDPVFRFRFEAETETLRQLDHPNVVRFFDSGLHEGTPYLVMEYAEGRDLEIILQQRRNLPWIELLDVAMQVTAGLKHAHQRGILHLDIKPGNVLVTGDDAKTVKLLDFGLATLFGQETPSEPGTVVGTLAYLAPERATGKPVTKRSDVYSLGGLFYTLATGRPPFVGNTAVEILHKHCFTQPERPARLVADLPHDIDDLIFRMLDKDPAGRPGDAGVVLRELERIRGKLRRQGRYSPGESSAASTGHVEFTPPTIAELPSPLMRRPAVVIPLFLLTVGVIVFGFWYSGSRPSAEELYSQARPLLDSDDPADWERAWDDYLAELESEYPGEYAEQVAATKRSVEDVREVRKAMVAGRLPANRPRNEAERFFRRGIGFCRAGDFVAARRTWENLIAAFGGVEEASRAVRSAEVGLALIGDPAAPSGVREGDPALTPTLARVAQLRREGKDEQARKIVDALESLYGEPPLDAAGLDEQLNPPKQP